MPVDNDQLTQLKSRLNALGKWMNDNDLNKPENKKILLDGLLKIESSTDTIIPQLADELGMPHDEVGFADFLSDIGNSVVDTQRKLDEQSRRYLEDIQSARHITPAIYRIPKVSASIKFGMRKTKSQGFNIIVAQNRKEDERTLNQSLDFEIISVPPPPGFQETLSGEVPSISFVFSPPVRKELFDEIKKYQPRQNQTGLKKDIDLLLASPNLVLILQIGPRMSPGMDDYLLLFANTDDDKNAGIWSLQRNPAGQPATVFEIILKFSAPDRPGENYKLLRDLILAHSAQQAKLLP